MPVLLVARSIRCDRHEHNGIRSRLCPRSGRLLPHGGYEAETALTLKLNNRSRIVARSCITPAGGGSLVTVHCENASRDRSTQYPQHVDLSSARTQLAMSILA